MIPRFPENSHEKPAAGDYSIREAGNVEEALKLYRAQASDVVFLDLTTPVMDGFETLKHLRALDSQAKVVAVSADIQKEAKKEVMTNGALAFVAKPPTPEKIADIFMKLGQ